MIKGKGNLRIVTVLLAMAVAGSSMAKNMGEYASFGNQTQTAAEGRKIVVNPLTKWVNVTNGEIVTFQVGDQHFTYHVQTNSSTQSFALQAIAPANVVSQAVTVYVAQPSQS
jgi:hypothetical protein